MSAGASAQPHRDEQLSASPWFSPGTVSDPEILLRTVFDPEHVDEKSGRLSLAGVALDDLKSRGWSVDRKSYTSCWRIRWFHNRRLNSRARTEACLVIPFAASLVRRLPDDKGVQAFVVRDDAQWHNPAHASTVLAANIVNARKLRTSLIEELPPIQQLEEIFGKADRFGWLWGWRGALRSFLRAVRRALQNSAASR